MPDLRVVVHARTRDRVAVVEAVGALLAAEGLVPVDARGRPPKASVRVLVGAPQGEWVAVCPEDPAAARPLGPALAARLERPTLVIGVVDDEAVFYEAHDARGDAIDAYHQCPDYEKEVDEDDADEAEVARTRGDARALGAAFGAADVAPLAEALAAGRIERLRDHDPADERLAADEVLAALRAALRLPELVDFDERLAEGQDAHVLTWTRPPPERRVKLPPLPAVKLPKLPTFPWSRRPAAKAEDGAGPEGTAEADDDDDDDDDAAGGAGEAGGARRRR